MIGHAFAAAGHWLKLFFTKNLAMKIGSLIFAFLLWAYVTTTTNPLRSKTLSDVPVTYVGAEDIQLRGLTPSMPFYDTLNTVTVTVEVPTQDVSSVTRSSVSASVDLTGITGPGEYTLPVLAATDTDNVSITSTMPANVTVEIEESVQKQVPIEVQLEGTRISTLYYGVPKLSQSTITLSGPRSGIEQVARAVCTIDVSGLTETTTATHSLTLMTQDGGELPSTLFAGVPSVIVEVPIYPTRVIDLNVDRIQSAVAGIPEGYEITDVTVEPASVRVAGPQDAIDAIQYLSTESMDADNAEGTVTFENVSLALPDSVYAAVPDEVEVTIEVTEIQDEKRYSGVEVVRKNLSAGLTAALDPEAVTVILEGAASELNDVRLSEIHPFVDLAGLGPGTYEVDVEFENDADFSATLTTTPGRVTVTISEQQS